MHGHGRSVSSRYLLLSWLVLLQLHGVVIAQTTTATTAAVGVSRTSVASSSAARVTATTSSSLTSTTSDVATAPSATAAPPTATTTTTTGNRYTVSFSPMPTYTACQFGRVMWDLQGDDPKTVGLSLTVLNNGVDQDIPVGPTSSSSESKSVSTTSTSVSTTSTTISTSSASTSSSAATTTSPLLPDRRSFRRTILPVNKTIVVNQNASQSYPWLVDVPEGRYYLHADADDGANGKSQVFTVVQGPDSRCLSDFAASMSSVISASSASVASVAAAESSRAAAAAGVGVGDQAGGGGGLSGGAIAGIVVGVVVALAALVITGLIVRRRRSKRWRTSAEKGSWNPFSSNGAVGRRLGRNGSQSDRPFGGGGGGGGGGSTSETHRSGRRASGAAGAAGAIAVGGTTPRGPIGASRKSGDPTPSLNDSVSAPVSEEKGYFDVKGVKGGESSEDEEVLAASTFVLGKTSPPEGVAPVGAAVAMNLDPNVVGSDVTATTTMSSTRPPWQGWDPRSVVGDNVEMAERSTATWTPSWPHPTPVASGSASTTPPRKRSAPAAQVSTTTPSPPSPPRPARSPSRPVSMAMAADDGSGGGRSAETERRMSSPNPAGSPPPPPSSTTARSPPRGGGSGHRPWGSHGSVPLAQLPTTTSGASTSTSPPADAETTEGGASLLRRPSGSIRRKPVPALVTTDPAPSSGEVQPPPQPQPQPVPTVHAQGAEGRYVLRPAVPGSSTDHPRV